MVENRPEHEHVPQQADNREPPGADRGDPVDADAGIAIEPSEADAIAEAEPARAPEQAFDLAADQRQEAESAAGLPDPGFATTTARSDADAVREQPSEPKRSGVAAMILPPVLTIAIATGLVVGAAKTGLLPQFLSSASTTAPADDAALEALKQRIAGLEARPASTPAAVADATALDALTARVASLEARPAGPAADSAAPAAGADPALAGRVDAAEKTAAALRGEIAVLRAEIDQLAATVKGLGETRPPATESAATPEPADKPAAETGAALAAIDQRLGELERAAKAPPPAPVAADDVALRRLVAATLLDLAVRQGQPYAPLLGAATPHPADAAELKPLDAFASSGVPGARTMGRDLIALLPKLLPDRTSPANFVDRFQANAERLVRLQRSDAVEGIDRTAIIGRLTAAAEQGDLAAALKELKALAPADRAPVQSWIDRAEARDQALAASQHFATAALSALQKPSR